MDPKRCELDLNLFMFLVVSLYTPYRACTKHKLSKVLLMLTTESIISVTFGIARTAIAFLTLLYARRRSRVEAGDLELGNQAQGPEHPYYYPPANGFPPQFQTYGSWPQTEPEDLASDREVEKKLLAVEELMRKQKLDFERAQRELAEREVKAQKELAERDANEAAAKTAVEEAKRRSAEKAEWEKRIFDEKEYLNKKAAEDNAMKEMEAERNKVEAELAEEKVRAAITLELKRLKEEAAAGHES
ncbi:hypothetical protein B0J14DRAFT_674233 [Halenospora varia]|nr:hypothetical protein B0J14DRAFT_674233 [Halenospora varia]